VGALRRPFVGSGREDKNPYFKAALVVWLLGALDVPEGGEARPSAITNSSPRVSWRNSFLLESAYEDKGSVNEPRDFLPRENCAAFVRAIRRAVTADVLLARADSFSEDALPHENLFHAPDLFSDRLSKADAG
jgi:hypothetical protein